MDGLLELLDNSDARKMILAAYICPRSAAELGIGLGLSASGCRRLVGRLERSGLLVQTWTGLMEKGRPKMLYRANIRSARVVMENDRMMMQFELPAELSGFVPLVEVVS